MREVVRGGIGEGNDKNLLLGLKVHSKQEFGCQIGKREGFSASRHSGNAHETGAVAKDLRLGLAQDGFSHMPPP